ncbi:MAG: PAS domain S-box protein [Alphaproteobacteria bacterium]|nr:PAS domain S-box protein [Alphaproteobacteria bacterium]
MTSPTGQDGSFFLEKKPPAKKSSSLRRRNIKAVLLFSLSAVYGLFALGILYILVNGGLGTSLIALYAYGLIGGLALLLLNRSYSDADRSRRILTEVLEKSAEARCITDPDGTTIYSNTRFIKLVEGLGEPALAAFTRLFEHSKKIEKTLEELQNKASPAGTASTEIQTKVRGKLAWFQVTCQFIIGWPGYIHWRFDDITHRYQMEAAIREEREKLRDFTDNAPVGFFSVDGEGRLQFANDTLLRLLGADARTIIGKTRLHDFLVNPAQKGKPYDCFEDGGYHQHGETLMKGAGGRIFKAAITHSITRDEEGKILSRSVVYDLTTEQKMQQALKESEDRFERLFEEAPVGICMLTATGVISDANATLAAMLRLPVNALNGKPLLHFINKDMQHRAEDWLRQLARGEASEPFIEVPVKGSIEIVVQIYARKFKGGENFVLHFIDLTEQKKLEKQFTQSQKMQAVGQLAGGIAHDFNNLLTAMIGFCDLLLLRHKPGDPSFADIMQIKQNANRAANLVRQLLAFSRQQTMQPRVLDLAEVLSELSHLLRRLIGANIELRLSHSTDISLIKADQGQMEQVLINLVVNARDAMANGGKLLIRTSNITNKTGIKLANDETLPPGDWAMIEVEDTGTGINPDIMGRIFEPFFSTKEVGAGTGLGLATVHGIVHQTGGYISVKSVLAQGTTFIIYLPRFSEAAGAKKAETVEEKAVTSDLTGSAKILLVEDEDAVRTFSARALSNKGYQVMDASGGVAALKILEEKKFTPEILVTDVMMPEMDGTTLAKQVKEKYPQIKIIFISGYAEDRFKEHLGADVYFLPKPFTLKQLATKVKEVIETKA